MKNESHGPGRSFIGVAALVVVMLASHVVLAQTTTLEGWPRSAIAIGVGVVVMVLASTLSSKRKPSPPESRR